MAVALEEALLNLLQLDYASVNIHFFTKGIGNLVYHDDRVLKNFDHKGWIDINGSSDVTNMARDVLSSVTSTDHQGIEDLHLLQVRLREILTEKKLLLVLDDVVETELF